MSPLPLRLPALSAAHLTLYCAAGHAAAPQTAAATERQAVVAAQARPLTTARSSGHGGR